MLKKQPLPTPNINSLLKKSNLKATSSASIKRKIFKPRVDSKNSKNFMKELDQLEIPIQRIFPRLKIRLPKSREDIKLLTIRSTSWKNKLKLRKWLLQKNTLSIRRRIKLFLNIVENSRKRKRKWMPRDKLLKTFRMKFLSFIQVSDNFRVNDSIKRMNMNLFWQKEISLELSWSEETMSLLFSMKR